MNHNLGQIKQDYQNINIPKDLEAQVALAIAQAKENAAGKARPQKGFPISLPIRQSRRRGCRSSLPFGYPSQLQRFHRLCHGANPCAWRNRSSSHIPGIQTSRKQNESQP